MYYYLKQHPQIYMPEHHKEPHYFVTDFPSIRFKHGLDEYLGLFSNAENEDRIGEATTWYLYSKMAAGEIKAFEPRAKIIIMLRNPVDLMYSLHNQWIFSGNEDISDFFQALALEDRRKKGESLPNKCFFPEGLFYKEVVRFGDQVKRYLDVFGDENVHVIIFEDFKAHTDKIYRNVIRFLGVDDSYTPDFDVINVSKRAYISAINRFLFSADPAAWISKMIKRIISPQARQKIRKKIIKLNTYAYERKPLNASLKNDLLREFEPEILSLSEIIGRDLKYWLNNKNLTDRNQY
jgi:hypothetical protein